MNQTLTPTEALNVIAQACAQVQANLQTHQTIQTALKTIADELAPANTPAPEVPIKN